MKTNSKDNHQYQAYITQECSHVELITFWKLGGVNDLLEESLCQFVHLTLVGAFFVPEAQLTFLLEKHSTKNQNRTQ